MKQWLRKLLRNNRNKKIMFFGVIALCVLLLIALIVLSVIHHNNHSGIEVPEVELPKAEIQQVEMPKYTRTSTKSWDNGAIFGTLNKDLVTSVHFVNSFSGESTGMWMFDGLQCYVDEIYTVYIVVGNGVKLTGSMNGAFANLPSLHTVSGLRYLDTSDVIDMSNLFKNCKELTSADIEDLKTNNLLLADSMFYGCEKLSTIDLGKLNMSNVIDADNMFTNCYALKDLILTPMPSAMTMKQMLYRIGSASITGTNIAGNFSMSNCEDATEMCSKSTFNNLDFAKTFNPISLKTAHRMFAGCNADFIDLSSWDVSSIEDMSYMFADIVALNECIMTGWEPKSLKNIEGMFFGCSSIRTITIDWQSINIMQNAAYLFKECANLKEISLPAFENTKFGNAQEMFYQCWALEKIYCGKLTADVSDRMFTDCELLPNYNSDYCDAKMADTNNYFSTK